LMIAVALLAATFARMISRVKLFVSQLFADNWSFFVHVLRYQALREQAPAGAQWCDSW
jgi:hypothetical protein